MGSWPASPPPVETGILERPATALLIGGTGIGIQALTWLPLFIYGVAVHEDMPRWLDVVMAAWVLLPLAGAVGVISAFKARRCAPTWLPLLGGIVCGGWLLLGALAWLAGALRL